MALSKTVSSVPEAVSNSPWAWIREGLPPAERRQCQHSLMRAIMAGESKQLCREAFLEYVQTQQDLKSAGVWSQVQLFQRERWSQGSDPLKRAREGAHSPRSHVEAGMDEDFMVLVEATDGFKHEPGRAPSTTGTMSVPPLPRCASPAWMPSTTGPYVTEQRMPYLEPHAWNDVVLPEDVPSWEMWGKTIICFGKFSGQNVTYQTMSMSEEASLKDYRKWVIGRVESSSGQCRDLGLYLKQAEKFKGHRAVIPGTNQMRTYAD